MAKKNWMDKLTALEGAVVGDYDPYAHIIQTGSPSFNFTFGRTWGLPLGYSLALWGPEKSGKSLGTNMMIAQLHADDPDGIAVKFNTEQRERLQMTPTMRSKWGIDNGRYVAYEVNAPALIFDRIEQDLYAMWQDGCPIKLVAIDSLQGIQGRRAMNAKSVDVQQIGDHAKTLQDGLARILPIQRKMGFALVLVCQARAEMDMAEQMRGNTMKMAAPFAVRHHCEYFMMVEKNKTKEGRTDLHGNEFRDEEQGDLSSTNKGEQTGHKIRVQMKDSSAGPKGRVGEFTIDYSRGLINVHEEVFKLGCARKVIERPNNQTYAFGDKEWRGKDAFLNALEKDLGLQAAIVKELKARDIAGLYSSIDDEEYKRMRQEDAERGIDLGEK